MSNKKFQDIDLSEFFKKFVQKIKEDKKSFMIVVLGLIGITLITFSGSSSDMKNEQTQNKNFEVQSSEVLTNQLIDLISNIEGTSNVNAMLTFESSTEKVYAYDKNEKYNDDNSVINEVENEYIIISEGSDEKGLIIKNVYPKIRGVAIVCDGADNALIREKIISAVCAVFDVSSNKVSVSQSK